jgi:hypothetical protein
MTKLSCQKALYGLAAVLFGITANGMSQEAGLTMAVQAPGCSWEVGCAGPQTSVTMMGGPVIGAGPLGVVSTGGMAFALPANVEVVKNQPYEAKAITEIKQTLADGTHITQTTTATVARDDDGRTVRIQKLSIIGPRNSASDSSETSTPTLTTIFDPVTQTHTDYTSDSRVAHVLPMPPPPAGATTGSVSGSAMAVGPGPATVEGPMPLAVQGHFLDPGPRATEAGPMTFAVQGHHVARGETGFRPDIKPELLGNKTIEGIPVTGTKTTSTIPVGTIGNDKDLVITRKTWYSPDLKLVIESTQTDPRFGETTYTLTNIQRNEPDPSLFQVPAGYKVEKVPVVMRPN